jgi:pimeloyl-ACP methyl ester carboxylesterase
MTMIASGPPLVLVPGIQGRWEWMTPTVDALARHFRVLTSSLPGDSGSLVAAGERDGFEAQALLVDRLLERAGVERATLVGVSFGGLVAAYIAATRPDRVGALVLANTPGPHWVPDALSRWYMRTPRLMAPVFALGSPWRLGPEILSAFETPRERLRFVVSQLGCVLRAPVRPSLMGRRLRLMASTSSSQWCGQIKTPTLVLTGEPQLDRVVPVAGTREYVGEIAGAAWAELPRTGHIGCVTHAGQFADMIWQFARGIVTV